MGTSQSNALQQYQRTQPQHLLCHQLCGMQSTKDKQQANCGKGERWWSACNTDEGMPYMYSHQQPTSLCKKGKLEICMVQALACMTSGMPSVSPSACHLECVCHMGRLECLPLVLMHKLEEEAGGGSACNFLAAIRGKQKLEPSQQQPAPEPAAGPHGQPPEAGAPAGRVRAGWSCPAASAAAAGPEPGPCRRPPGLCPAAGPAPCC